MIKKISVLFLALAFFSIAFAQERNVASEKRIVPDMNYQAPNSPSNPIEGTTLVGETFITTDYDYGGNNVIPKMISLADIDGTGNLDPFFVGMVRDNVAAVARYISFGYSAFGAPIDAFRAFAPAQSLGWGTTQLCVGGTLDGKALVMAHAGGTSWHSVIDLENLAPVQPFPQTTFGTNFPDFVYQNDGTIWATNTDANIYKSTNTGGSFTLVAPIGAGDPNVTLTAPATNGPSENPIYGNSTGQYMAVVGAWGVMTVPDANDGVYWYGTNDFGATWNGLVIGVDAEYGQVANNPNLAPYFENFGQLNANVDETGTTHVVMNGYGEGINGVDTVNAFPIVYWNSNLGHWMEVSIPAIAFEPNATMATLRPGNGIGQAYPSVSVTNDGQFIFVIWTAPEYTGTVGASPIRIYPGDGGQYSAEKFYTDLHWTTSTDGGQTWATPQVIGEPSVSETYANVARRLEILPNNDVKAHFVFFVDAIPGTSLFTPPNSANNNGNALGTWQYMSAIVGNYSPAATSEVTFQVDMGVQASKGRFTVGDAVKIAGNFNGWNNGADVMTDVDGDTIYTITKTLNVGDTLSFKFIKGADGWENDPNRVYVVPANNSTYYDYFDRDDQYAIPAIIDITFACNMELEIASGRFNPTTDTLTTRGSFNGWGSTSYLFQSTTDPNVYDGTFSVNTFEGETINYKFAYFGPNGTTWENDPNKTYTVTADDITFGAAFIERGFNNLTLANVTNFPATIKFTVNMAGAISSINLQPFPSIDDVRICGANAPLQWPAGGWPNADSIRTIKLYDNGTNGDVTAGDNVWSRDVTFPQYSPLTIQYKYGANWGLPSNNGGNDNENGVGADHFITLTSDLVSATVVNVFGTMGNHPLINVVTDVNDIKDLVPVVYELGQNYPNPFNPSTTIKFSIPESGMVTLRVFNMLGQEVATLLNGEKAAGVYEASFDASALSSGIYFYTLDSKNFSSTKKMVLLK
jgi:hypothetical protein